jgi:hypothetical protein
MGRTSKVGRKKGQTMVFEQVMLFAIGVMIFIICFASFSAYQGYFVETGNEDQLNQVLNYIGYAIVKNSEGWNGTESYISIKIPKTIGGEMYSIRLYDNGLNITMLPSMKTAFSGLYGLNRTTGMVDSEAMSASGVIVLYKNGNKIILT